VSAGKLSMPEAWACDTVAGAEEIKDGLAALRRPPPTHSTSLARVACIAHIT